jgi:hypothetical protein
LTICHPGFCFPQLAGQRQSKGVLEVESFEDRDAKLKEGENLGTPKVDRGVNH